MSYLKLSETLMPKNGQSVLVTQTLTPKCRYGCKSSNLLAHPDWANDPKIQLR